MPMMICPSCQHLTNTAYRFVTQCRLRIDDDLRMWVLGCKDTPEKDDVNRSNKKFVINDHWLTTDEIVAMKKQCTKSKKIWENKVQ